MKDKKKEDGGAAGVAAPFLRSVQASLADRLATLREDAAALCAECLWRIPGHRAMLVAKPGDAPRSDGRPVEELFVNREGEAFAYLAGKGGRKAGVDVRPLRDIQLETLVSLAGSLLGRLEEEESDEDD